MCGKFIFDNKMSDRTLHLQAHKVLDMSLILSIMYLTPFPVHGLNVLSGVCLAALLSVLFFSFSCHVKVAIQFWSELLALFAVLMVIIHQ